MTEITGSAQGRAYELVKANPYITIPEILNLENPPSYKRENRRTHYCDKLSKLEKCGFVERVPNTKPSQWRVVE